MILMKLFLEFFKAGLFAFGGGFSIIPLIEGNVVENYHWLTPQEFTDIVAIAGTAPGVFAVNTATFIGYKVAKCSGALASVIGVTLPSFFVILAIATFFPRVQDNHIIQSVLKGLGPAAVGLILVAALTVGTTAITGVKSVLITILVVCGIYFFKVHPILALLGAGIAGLLFFR
jgi:chromate transporter